MAIFNVNVNQLSNQKGLDFAAIKARAERLKPLVG